MSWIVDWNKGLLALIGSMISVIVGLSLAITSFDLAVLIQIRFWLILPCLLVASLVPLFLISIPRHIYWWRDGFPQKGFLRIPPGSRSRFLERYRKWALS